MEIDFKVIMWIVIGLIYLFSRRKKAEQPGRPAERAPEDSEPDDSSGPKTFEDLLREIEGMKRPEPAPRRAPEPEVIDYDDDLGEERRGLEEVKPSYRSDDEIYKVYEDAKASAFVRPSLEDTIKLEDTIVRFKQFKGYEKVVKRTGLHEYLKELRDPHGMKKAIILSEILKPRF